MNKILIFWGCLMLIALTGYSQQDSWVNKLRAPAYPLITVDPYMSAWSFSDKLYEDNVKHWTGANRPLTGVLRVDGKCYRFMGTEILPFMPVVPDAMFKRWVGRYTMSKPPMEWTSPFFDDSDWKEGKAAFGTNGQRVLETLWTTPDIWVRRSFTLKNDISAQNLFLKYSHDDVFELYLNGVQIVKTDYCWKNDVFVPLSDKIKKLLHKGVNVIAAHCHNTVGGAYVDFGLYRKAPETNFFSQTAEQQSVNVLPTQTRYMFKCGPVQLNLTFLAPLLTDELDVLSRPVDYVGYSVASADGNQHKVQIYFEATPEWAVNDIGQSVFADRLNTPDLILLKAGTCDQNILQKKGDDVRIDWGYFYLAGKKNGKTQLVISNIQSPKKAFAQKGTVAGVPNQQPDKEMCRNLTAMAYSEDLGTVGSEPSGGKLMVGYDDEYAVQYFGKNLRAWWRSDKPDAMTEAFVAADKDYGRLTEKCAELDRKLVDDATAAGGEYYADLCALAYRQSIAAHKLVRGEQGQLYFFSKENFSNGSIGTVDVTYPSSPLFLYYNPDLLKGMMNFIFEYSESGQWNRPFPAHDVGKYPLANGADYGGDGMPVEEAGNMLILTTAIAAVEGKADYAALHWKVLSVWADYLLQKGMDPENQLCTDDFTGHLAHNANLSAKAIIGIAGYGKLARMLGKEEIAQKYDSAAREMAQKWVLMADVGDHSCLAFDRKDTWSQKYNLVWDKLLKLNLFPAEVINKEVDYYLTKQNKYGLPLDCRATFTKSDWLMWSAALSNKRSVFERLIEPMYQAFNETVDRVPMTDWYETTNAKQVGFRARSVVGGYFIKMLEQKLKK